MSNYTKTTNFASKDNLSPGNPLKIVKGTEIDTEFNNIQTAVGTKTDNSAANITGGTIVGITDLAVADGGTGASTATAALNNLLPTQTGNANKYLQTDGTNATWDAVSLSTSDITGTLPVANGGTGVTTSTGTGAVVLSNSPTLVTPALGTPASGTATNLTGLPISTGVSGLGSGVATFLGTPSSANLASAVTDETGSGALVFANSPTLVTPALGTPSALVGTNITGTASGLTAGNVTTNANLTGAITSTGNATSLGSFSSANLLGALTDETGTGSAVFATSPTLVTPILGTPTSATLTNATGLPIATGVSGLGTGVATALAVNVGSTGAPLVNGGVLGTPSSGTATNLTGLPLSTGVTGQLPVANGGTGTATPSIVAGTNVTVTGTWPNQTIASTAGGSGTVTSVAATVPSIFSISGSPITTSGTLAMTYSGTALPVANGGTGQTSYTDGQLLIGNTTGNTLTKTTLTAGSGITITNGSGAITIASSGGASAATPTALGTVYGKQTSGGGTPFLTAIGYNAGGSTTGIRVTAVGEEALYTNSTGARNIALGNQAGYSNNGDNNLFIGVQSGFTNTTGTGNSFVGGMDSNNWPAGYYNTTGSDNNAFGGGALRANTTGSSNTAIGTGALHLNTTAGNNVAVGYQAGYNNTTGAENTAVGYQALKANTTGSYNTTLGSGAGFGTTTGESSVFVGQNAGRSATTGGSNTIIGTGAGYTGTALTTGYNNIYVGTNAAAAAATEQHAIVVGANSTSKGNSTGFINPNSGGVYQGNNTTTWSTTSDQRLKKNIVNNNSGLEKLTQIQVRNFEYRLPEEVTDLPQDQAIQKTGVQLGVIAQELQVVLPECVKTESTGVLSVDADNLTWYLINAVKELKAEVDSLKSQLQGN